MRASNLIFCCFLFYLGLSCAIQKNVVSTKIFTSINLNKGYGELSLGDSFREHADKIKILGPNSIFLKDNVFSGAESIQLVFNVDKEIERIIFVYNKNEVFEDKVQNYIKDFGGPIFKTNTAIWYDGSTQFEIQKRKFHNEMRLRSVLTRIDK